MADRVPYGQSICEAETFLLLRSTTVIAFVLKTKFSGARLVASAPPVGLGADVVLLPSSVFPLALWFPFLYPLWVALRVGMQMKSRNALFFTRVCVQR